MYIYYRRGVVTVARTLLIYQKILLVLYLT